MTTAPGNIVGKQGVPIGKSYRFVNAVQLWPNATGCEARAQIKVAPGDGPVVFDLTPYLSVPAVVTDGDGAGTDIVVNLAMNGQETRELPTGPGYVYDLFLSDSGEADARAIAVDGKVLIARAYTSAGSSDV